MSNHTPREITGLDRTPGIVGLIHIIMAILEFQGEYRWLSNFAPSEVQFEGMWFDTVEHAYQAAKTVNSMERKLIQDCTTPGKAKRQGQNVTLRDDWTEETRLSIMRNLLEQKFTKSPYKEKLIATGTEKIVEGNLWGDIYWGMCKGIGKNHLGNMIMEIREGLMPLK